MLKYNHNEKAPALLKVTALFSLVAWQLILFYLTYYLYHLFEYRYFLNLESWLDHALPYIPWTWTIYYFGFIYIAVWAAVSVWYMNKKDLMTTVTAFSVIITSGAVIRMIFPSDSPWQLLENMHSAQVAFKTNFNIEPLGGFPSMHAAISTMTAFINIFTFSKFYTKLVSVILALAVCLSIITAKEHWALDVPAGILIGLIVGLVWLKKYNNSKNE